MSIYDFLVDTSGKGLTTASLNLTTNQTIKLGILTLSNYHPSVSGFQTTVPMKHFQLAIFYKDILRKSDFQSTLVS